MENELFANHSWYFRNALVRANHNDYLNQIFSTNEYLMRFFGNLLLDENNELKNRHLRVEAISEVANELDMTLISNSGGQKAEIGGQKKWSD
ncbi:MAG: hypothetical protein ACOYMD_02595 [Paludibacter sp.]